MHRVSEYDVEEAIRDFLRNERAAPDVATIAGDTPILGDILDLPALLRLIMYLEETFDFDVGPQVLLRDDYATPARIGKYVVQHLARSGETVQLDGFKETAEPQHPHWRAA